MGKEFIITDPELEVKLRFLHLIKSGKSLTEAQKIDGYPRIQATVEKQINGLIMVNSESLKALRDAFFGKGLN